MKVRLQGVEGEGYKTRQEVRRMHEEFQVLKDQLSEILCDYQDIRNLKNELEEIRKWEQERNKEKEGIKKKYDQTEKGK